MNYIRHQLMHYFTYFTLHTITFIAIGKGTHLEDVTYEDRLH